MTFKHCFLRAIAECSARLSHGLGVSVRPFVRLFVCLSVTLLYCVKTVQAKITKFSSWAAARSLVFRDKISCSWVRRFSSNEASNRGTTSLKDVILPLLGCIV